MSLDKNFKRLIDVILNDPEYYPGSCHKNCNIAKVVDCVYELLYNQQENQSLHLVIEKEANNSLNLIVDKIS